MSITNSCKSAWNSLPQGVFALFCIQIFSTLSFSVLYSTLVLYITGPLKLSPTFANSIMGVFVAFNFALHLLGGYLGGRYLSYRSLFCVGMLAQIIGCVLLATVNSSMLYYGLAAFLTGSGLNVTCLNCLLTQRYNPDDSRRESAFLYNYAGMNIGFFVGYGLSGYFQLVQNYQQLFLLSSIGNLIAVFICLYCWSALKDIDTPYSALMKRKKMRALLWGLLIIGSLAVFLSKFLHYVDLANKLVLLTGVSMLVVIYVLALRQSMKQAREKIYAFTVLMIVGTVFWTLYQTGPMGLTQFIENNVESHWLTITIPPQWFQNINTICIIIGGPALSFIFNHMRNRGFIISIPLQFAYALLLIGISFVLLPFAISKATTNGLIDPIWIVLSFILQSAGELLISPIGYAMIGALAPAPLQGIMMGMWMLSTGVGATLSSYSSNWMTVGQDSTNPVLTNAGYSHVFLSLGLIAMIASIILFILSPMLRRWMDEKNTSVVDDGVCKFVNKISEL